MSFVTYDSIIHIGGTEKKQVNPWGKRVTSHVGGGGGGHVAR